MKKLKIISLTLTIISISTIFNNSNVNAMQVERNLKSTELQYLKNFNEDIRVSSNEFEEIKVSLRDKTSTALDKYFQPNFNYTNPLVSREYEIVNVETTEEYEAEPDKYDPIFPDLKIERFIVEEKDSYRILYVRTTLTFNIDNELQNNLPEYSRESNQIGLHAFYPYESIVPLLGGDHSEIKKCALSFAPCSQEDQRLYIVSFLTRVTLDESLNGASENQANSAANITPTIQNSGTSNTVNSQNTTPPTTLLDRENSGNGSNQKDLSAPNTGFITNSDNITIWIIGLSGLIISIFAFRKIQNIRNHKI